MRIFTIKGKEVTLDESKVYLDFFKEEDQPQLVQLNVVGMLEMLQARPINDDDINYFAYLERWNLDAPRKKFYRNLRRTGVTVLSDEYFFEDHENSDEILNNLQNTGTFAKEVLEIIAPEKIGEFWKNEG
jgi:hypothetical protein